MTTYYDTHATFTIVIAILILQRLGELSISKRNEKWLRQNGAVEYGKSHYKYIVIIHFLFFVSMVLEFLFRKNDVSINWWLVGSEIVLQIIRAWILMTLGNYWTTKIMVVPNTPLIRKGFYRYMRHPNYALVVLELIVVPLIFNLYLTAGIFLLLNGWILSTRMREEDKALGYR